MTVTHWPRPQASIKATIKAHVRQIRRSRALNIKDALLVSPGRPVLAIDDVALKKSQVLGLLSLRYPLHSRRLQALP